MAGFALVVLGKLVALQRSDCGSLHVDLRETLPTGITAKNGPGVRRSAVRQRGGMVDRCSGFWVPCSPQAGALALGVDARRAGGAAAEMFAGGAPG